MSEPVISNHQDDTLTSLHTALREDVHVGIQLSIACNVAGGTHSAPLAKVICLMVEGGWQSIQYAECRSAHGANQQLVAPAAASFKDEGRFTISSCCSSHATQPAGRELLLEGNED